MVDRFGNRMSGTQNLEDTIDYMVEVMKSAGLDNVHTEDAPVPHWIRGFEVAEMLTPRKQKLKMAGLGLSIGTVSGGITANLVAVESFDELENLPSEQVQGKIVLWVPKWRGYHHTVDYRDLGAPRAAKKGAVASLVRSMTPLSIGSLHYGTVDYIALPDYPKIPAAVITVEDAYTLLRFYRQGKNITIHLEMQEQNLPAFTSRNVIGEFTGKLEKPVVIVAGHIDTWDIGNGAADDGGGCYISWKGVELLKRIGLPKPRRTIRAILWTGEEQGYFGAVAYEKDHKADEENEFDFFIESDMGTFDPKGLDFSGNKESECIFKEILKLMGPLNATEFSSPTLAGSDIGQWTARGFPSASLMSKDETYYWFHHSDGDSMAVEDSDALDKDTALFAAAAYVIADLSIDMPKTVKG